MSLTLFLGTSCLVSVTVISSSIADVSLFDSRLDCSVSEITWSDLVSPRDKNGYETTVQLGHGKCQKHYYKGIPAAVKVFNATFRLLEMSFVKQQLRLNVHIHQYHMFLV